MLRFLLAVGLLVAATCAASAEPSARRVYLLCNAEDPECGPLLRDAFQAFLANPTLTECYSQDFGGGVYDSTRRCWETTTVCHYQKTPDLNFDLFYQTFMTSVETGEISQYPAHLGVFLTMKAMGRCGG
jgi:hypothetical protein